MRNRWLIAGYRTKSVAKKVGNPLILLTQKRFYLSKEIYFFRRSIIMKLVRCPNCGFVCKRNGKTNAGSQRLVL